MCSLETFEPPFFYPFPTHLLIFPSVKELNMAVGITKWYVVRNSHSHLSTPDYPSDQERAEARLR